MVVQDPVNVRSVPDFAFFRPFPGEIEFVCDQLGGLSFNESLKNVTNRFGVFFVNYKFFVFRDISQRNCSAHPDAFLAAGRHLVADALSGDFSFILAESDQYVQHHASGWRRRIYFLGYGNELHAPFIKLLGQIGKVANGAGKTVYFVNDNNVDKTCFAVFQQLLQSRPLHVAS